MHIKEKNNWLKHLDFLILDIVVISLSFVAANLIYLRSLHYYESSLYGTIFFIILSSKLIIDFAFNPYSGVLKRNNVEEARMAFAYTVHYFLAYTLITYFLKYGSLFSRAVIILTYTIFFIFGYFFRIAWKKMIIDGKAPAFVTNDSISLLIVTERNNIQSILNNINKETYNIYHVSGLCIFDKRLKGEIIDGYPVLCNRGEIYDCVMSKYIKEVFFALEPEKVDKKLISTLVDEGVGIQLDINSIFGLETDNQIINKVGIYKTLGMGVYTFTPSQSVYLVIKRLFDIILSIVVMPFVLLLSVLIKIIYVASGDQASIFYTQKRIGKDGKPFQIFKFRSMVPNADKKLLEILKDEKKKNEWADSHKLISDPRITPLGKLLRKTSLDELPQFLNILRGEMSLVGPRPLVEGELKMHDGLRLYERVKPGITGWWACNGRSNITYKERLELEYYYVKNCSLGLDILTIIRTVICVITKTGAR